MGGWTPHPDLPVEARQLCLHCLLSQVRRRCGGGRGSGREGVGDVGVVEVAALLRGGITLGMEEVRLLGVVVGCPFVEVIRDVERRRIWRCVLKVNNDDLRKR